MNWPTSRARQKQYVCRPCQAAAVRESDEAERIAAGIVGTRTKLRALPRSERLALLETARKLRAHGAQFTREAERIESSVKEGFVYVVVHPSWPEFVKIGCALDVESRLSSFQTGCPQRAYRAIHSVFVPDRRRTEADVHAALALYRAEGEWFRVTHAVAISTLNDHSTSGDSA